MQISTYSSYSNYYNQSLANTQKYMQQISSGSRINSAADDAAGLAISQGMLSQINGYAQAYDNKGNALSMLQTSEGAMGDSTSVLQRMRELSVQAGDGTLTASDRNSLQQEMNQLKSQLDGNASNTEFNTIKTNDGSLNTNIQVGANSGQTQSISIGDTSSNGLSLNFDISTQSAASTTLDSIDNALKQLTANRTQVGAVSNGLEFSNEYTAQSKTNLESAYAGISDADIAMSAMNLNQSKIQSYVSIMAMSKTMSMQKGVLSVLA